MVFIIYILISPDMRKDVQDIFKMTPHDKQVMMFSATLSKEIRPVCKKFMQDVMSFGQYYLFEVSFARCPRSLRAFLILRVPWFHQHLLLIIGVQFE